MVRQSIIVWSCIVFACVAGLQPAHAENCTSIKPGAVWLDTAGNPINAHGGGMLVHNGTFYWYGEIKRGETYLPECNRSWGGTRVDATGVSCYSSTDCLNWTYEGNVLPAVEDDSSHDLYVKNVLERPKVIYNRDTGKFVLWAHLDSMDYAKAACVVAVADRPAGPFTYLHSLRPDAGAWPVNLSEEEREGTAVQRDFERGQMSRDMTLFVDDDGKAYLFYASEDNATLHVSELTDDYLRTKGQYKRLFIDRSMEAPAVFKHDGTYYLIASGCTAWDPNPARSAKASSIWGPWKELGNPCRGEPADTAKTFGSQSTYVLPVPDKDGAFIFLADRWDKNNLKDSRYVWLPVVMDAETQPTIRWHDEWDFSVFN